MSTVPDQTKSNWIIAIFGRIELYGAYVLEIVVAVIMLLTELRLLITFLEKPLGDWLLLCLWAFAPSIRFPIQPLPLSAFWDMFVLILGLIVFPLVMMQLGRDAIVQMMAWARDPNGQTLRQLRRQRARLADLQVKALEENEQNYYLKHGSFPFANSPEPPSISKYAGFWSFYYVTLSNYLGLPPQPIEKRQQEEEETTIDVDTLTNEQRQDIADEQRQDIADSPDQIHLVRTPYALLLFGDVRWLLKGSKKLVEALIEQIRARETLAYFALPARETNHTREQIINAVHNAHASDEEADFKKLHDQFTYDAKVLRQRLEDKCEEAGLAYIDPIVAPHGRKAINHLDDAYVAVDVVNLERMEKKMALLKEMPQAPLDLERFRKEYEEAVLNLPHEGLFGHLLRKEFALWHKTYYVRYRNMHHHLLWDLAEYEYALSQSQHGEEKSASLRQAATLYERCAFLTAPTREELKQGLRGRLSEQALRQCMMAYRDLENISAVYHIHSLYEKSLRARYTGWREEPETAHVFDEIIGSSKASELKDHEDMQREGLPSDVNYTPEE